jgi:aspartyl-tRNA(Asn)/glutamyl-tRNA(Gln) amidotransferase subunit B
MEAGNFRCEPNLSLRPKGSDTYGAKVELKNLNSFRAALRAMEFEVERQTRLLNEGKKVESETRGWREETGETASQRSKEQAHDYRYFPEPDLPPVAASREWIETIRGSLPELPDARRSRFMGEFGLSAYEANLLTESRARADFYEASIAQVRGNGDKQATAKFVANWMLGDLARLLNDSAMDIDDPSQKLSVEGFTSLLNLLQDGKITNSAAKQVLRVAFETGEDPETIVAERGLGRMDDSDALAAVVKEVIEANPKPVAEYQSGKAGAINSLIGRVMSQTGGRANAREVQTLLQKELDRPSDSGRDE